MKVRLKRPGTSYYDIESGWSISGEQVKELPENHSRAIRQRIRKGFIVLCEEPVTKTGVPVVRSKRKGIYGTSTTDALYPDS